MKYLLLLACLICSVSCFSQDPDPRLFQTWYLTYTSNSDISPAYGVWTINPPITPTLIIYNTPGTLHFTGTGACNTFTGEFISVLPTQLQTTVFTPTTSVCGPEIHNAFEASYFDGMRYALLYNIIPLSSGLRLVITVPMGQAIFQNFPLETTEFDLEKMTVYPNPGNSIIFLRSNQAILKIDVVNSYGQIVKTINDDFEAINIADLSCGIYLLKINTELGTINKKIIKE
ncbi:T9SS type A sorting domain-containing protein [Flavobacterium wongokense]|uniref:T9SS type A sorting domain-containing protein n=1 Tax=Flavobacterium wongokense TaxID=2910674 RepID=UPI001F166BA1|nr:T9SS type A sorting domain-containing protein [Flavobacterium sp. WG47]MCF6131932.1 T9SS type A sorting domain-containing protein [Flavobacterium sp. WG47]